jgi:hypothetical protein
MGLTVMENAELRLGIFYFFYKQIVLKSWGFFSFKKTGPFTEMSSEHIKLNCYKYLWIYIPKHFIYIQRFLQLALYVYKSQLTLGEL